MLYREKSGHSRTNGAVNSKINFKVEICSAL